MMRRFVMKLVPGEAPMLDLRCDFGGARFRRGYSEVKDAYRGPCTALSSLENTIANSELPLAA